MPFIAAKMDSGNPIGLPHEDPSFGQRPRGYQPRHRKTTTLSLLRRARSLGLTVAGVAMGDGPGAATTSALALRRLRFGVGAVAVATERVGARDVRLDHES